MSYGKLFSYKNNTRALSFFSPLSAGIISSRICSGSISEANFSMLIPGFGSLMTWCGGRYIKLCIHAYRMVRKMWWVTPYIESSGKEREKIEIKRNEETEMTHSRAIIKLVTFTYQKLVAKVRRLIQMDLFASWFFVYLFVFFITLFFITILISTTYNISLVIDEKNNEILTRKFSNAKCKQKLKSTAIRLG